MADLALAAAVGVGLETGEDAALDDLRPKPRKLYRRLTATGSAAGTLVATAPCPSNKLWLLNFARYTDIAAAWTLYIGVPPFAAAFARRTDFLAHAAIGAQLVAFGGNVVIYPSESVYLWTGSATPAALICDVEEVDR